MCRFGVRYNLRIYRQGQTKSSPAGRRFSKSQLTSLGPGKFTGKIEPKPEAFNSTISGRIHPRESLKQAILCRLRNAIPANASVFARSDRLHMGERPNTEYVVVEIVAEYYTNSDNVMDATELESAIIGMHEKCVARMKEFDEVRSLYGERPSGRGARKERGSPNPSTVASRLISDFDKDNDEVLDTLELMRAVHALHLRGPGKGGPRGSGRKGRR